MFKAARLALTSLVDKYIHANEPEIEDGEYYQRYDPLFKAVYRGDWDTAKLFLENNPEGVRVRIPGVGKTVLHAAVAKEHLHIVRGLMDIMTEEDVEIEQDDSYTALGAAISVGNLEIAKCLVTKNRRLLSIIHPYYTTPIVLLAVVNGQDHMVHYLYSATPPDDIILPDDGKQAALLLSQCINVQHLDIALDLLERAPLLAITNDQLGRSPVCALAQSNLFPSKYPFNFWQQWIYNCVHIPDSATSGVSSNIQNLGDYQGLKRIKIIEILIRCKEVLLSPLRWGCSYILHLLDIKGIRKMKLFHVQSSELLKRVCKVIEDTSDDTKIKEVGVPGALIAAACCGNVEFITGMAKANPTLFWDPDTPRRVIEAAVEYRQAKIFSLIYGLSDKTEIASYSVEKNSNMLHKVAEVAPLRRLKLVPGAALQMQRELQWFKAVEELASPLAREWPNNEHLKPRDLFTEKHKDLVVEGEKWMKDTASSSTVVAALIVTITFAAAFTFPGGNDQNNGFPMFSENKLFRVFMMSNAVALFMSATSVLMFLGILTSRYGEEDFLESLPKKLIVGLSTLFLSIAAMIIAFCAGFSLMYRNKLWVVVPSICLACIPVSFFVLMQFPLLVEIFLSTYGPSIFDKNVQRWI